MCHAQSPSLIHMIAKANKQANKLIVLSSLAYIAKLCLEIIKAKEKKEMRVLQFD